ncbi:taste receptor type 1 member 3-like [Ambystoma mexicanum]|uniref:taste receptor type 1 member 3-like n=1 Tax=Ambystoma mexicanum TaxID=8296 RepID=UPI0037E97A09
MSLSPVHALAFFLGFEMLPGPIQSNDTLAYQIFHSSGDVMLGGLFPFHTGVSNASNLWRPEPLTCINLNYVGVVQALAMRFAVEEINNSSMILPGRRLGYEIYDTCLQARVLMHSAMLLVSEGLTRDIWAICNLTTYNPRVMAVIGPGSAGIATPMVKLLSTFLIPQISYAITAAKFSNKNTFPSFLRTVPSDQHQVQGMIELVAHFGWNWVASLASDDEYGRDALCQLANLALLRNICIAYEGLIPTYGATSKTPVVIRDIIQEVHRKNINVVILFAPASLSRILFQEVLQLNMTKVWIASSAWVLSEPVLSLPGIREIGTVIGFSHRGSSVPGFLEYLVSVNAELKHHKSTLSSVGFGTSTLMGYDEEGDGSSPNFAVEEMSFIRLGQYADAVYTAVYSVAHALHEVLNCSSGKCRDVDSKIYPWQLLEAVKRVNFTVLNTSFYFDEYGNPNSGYDVVTHSMDNMGYKKIGRYSGQLDINDSLVNWRTNDNQVPTSQCFSRCEPGQVKLFKGLQFCCFDCDDCSEGTFQASYGEYVNVIQS